MWPFLLRFGCLSAAALLAAPLFGCSKDELGPGVGGKADAAVVDTPDPPTLKAYPEVTPEATAPIEGMTGAERIVVQGSPTGTLITTVLPGGQFCSDVELAPEGETLLKVYAASNGLLSPPTEVAVTRDPAAPRPAKWNCGDMDYKPCEAVETCGNEADDDCNGYADECDLACSGCVDDAFEPNNEAVNVPLIQPGSYDLKICPCRDDWFAFQKQEGRIVVNALFSHAEIDIDMRLYRVTEGGGSGEMVASSASSDDDESIDFTVDMPGTYYVRIYAFSPGKPQGSYTLEVQ